MAGHCGRRLGWSCYGGGVRRGAHAGFVCCDYVKQFERNRLQQFVSAFAEVYGRFLGRTRR
jgi:hypothetical protein